MISPVSHPSAVPQAEPAASNHPKPAATSSQGKTKPAQNQDTVTLSKKSSDIDHDGDNQ